MKLTFKPGKADKIHIYVDGEYKMTVDRGFAIDNGFFDGMEVSEQELSDLTKRINFRRSYNKAVSLLGIRDHSKKELISKLHQKGFGEGAQEACQKLEELGFIDDERFARMFAREQKELKNYGKNRIKSMLFQKGVSSQIIDEVLSELDFDSDELVSFVRRKYSRKLDEKNGFSKVLGSLVRRGYSFDEAKRAINCVLNEEDDDDEFDY